MSNDITKIEKEFFETFGIKPKTYLLCMSGWDCIDAQPCEQCAEQAKEELECDGIDCAWCGIVDCPREKNKS